MLYPIKDLLSQGKVEEAVDALLKIENLGFEEEKSIRLQSANYSQYKIEKRNETADNSTLNARQNRIILGLLDVVSTLELKKDNTQKPKKNAISIYLLAGTIGGCLILLGIIGWYRKGNSSTENKPIPIEVPFTYEDNSSKTKEEPVKIKKEVKPLSFQLTPYTKEIVMLLAENKELVSKQSGADLIIKLTYSGDLISTNERATLYRYKGGVLNIQLGDDKVCPIESLKIEASDFDFGNPKDYELELLDLQIQNHLENNHRLIAEQITKCLKK